MGFLWFKKKEDNFEDKWDELHSGLKNSFSNIKKDFDHVMKNIDHLHSRKDEHHTRIENLEKKLILLEEILEEFRKNKEKGVRSERSTIERVQSFNRSTSFMNVQMIKNLTPSQKQVVILLLNSKNPMSYKTIADQLEISIVTIRRHINDIKRAGVRIREKVSVKNRIKVFYLDDKLKEDLLKKGEKVIVREEKQDEEPEKPVKVRDYIG